VKELLKSVHICQSYHKNKSGTIFNGPRCSNSSLRNVCWTIFVYNTPIIFARRKQLCACAHKLWKGSIDSPWSIRTVS